ncbi:NAD(P)-binding protein [Nemania abortiva]|nr:NAD(P)-binding protein [Nemania abortiva]
MDITGNALVTGGGSGMGRACCLEFARQGVRGLMIADIDLEAAKKTKEEAEAAAVNFNFNAEVVELDVSLQDSVQNAVNITVDKFGRIDYAVHSTGLQDTELPYVEKADFEGFQRQVNANVQGTSFVTRLVCNAMVAQKLEPADESISEHYKTRGSIVNLASMVPSLSVLGHIDYGAAERAVLKITDTAAALNIGYQIRVNCVCPVLQRTDFSMFDFDGESQEKLTDMFLRTIPMRRPIRAEEVANAAIFLCSPKSSFTTGSKMFLDGGMSLKYKGPQEKEEKEEDLESRETYKFYIK